MFTEKSPTSKQRLGGRGSSNALKPKSKGTILYQMKTPQKAFGRRFGEEWLFPAILLSISCIKSYKRPWVGKIIIYMNLNEQEYFSRPTKYTQHVEKSSWTCMNRDHPIYE
jgi:hypothetical protein